MFAFLPTPQALAILAGISACPAPAQGPVDVLFKAEKPVYVQNNSSAQLGKMKRVEVFQFNGRMISRILGFTQGDISYQYAVQADVAPFDSGMQCLSVTHVTLNITYSPKVFISSDHDFLGCSFAHVAKHEGKHYKADVAIMTKHLPDLKAQLEKAALAVAVNPVIPAAAAQRRDDIRTDLQQAMQPLIGKIRAERLAAHAAFDTDAAYEADAKACAYPP